METARILAVLPAQSISHQVVFRPLIQELAKRGHELVVITADPAYPKGDTPANLTEIDLHDIYYKIWRDAFVSKKRDIRDDTYSQLKYMSETISFFFYKQLESDEVQKLLRDKTKTFDLLFIEACIRPALVFSNFYKAPVILISSLGPSLGNVEAIGAPVHSMLYPSIWRNKINNLTIWEKIVELYMHYLLTNYLSNYEEKENEMLRRLIGAEFRLLSDLKNNIAMLFLNVNPLWQGNRPMPPGVVYMGGIQLKSEKELSEVRQ